MNVFRKTETNVGQGYNRWISWTFPVMRHGYGIWWYTQSGISYRYVSGTRVQNLSHQLNKLWSLPPAYEVRREVMFSVCSHPGGGGLPHLHPIILPLVPCPFQGYPSDWSQVRMGDSPVTGPRSGWAGTQWLGTPHPLARSEWGWWGPPSLVGGPSHIPSHGWGTPPPPPR